MQTTDSKNKSLSVLSDPKYRGQHLVIVKDKVFASRTGRQAARVFKEVIKKYPKEKPTYSKVLRLKVFDRFCIMV